VQYDSRAKTFTDKDSALIREVTYQVSFGATYKPTYHWLRTKTCTARYRWDNTAEKFVFDAHNSTVSEEELKKEFGGGTKDDFIKYNFDRLLQLAETANSEQRAWLEEVLEQLTDDSQKMKLQKALGR